MLMPAQPAYGRCSLDHPYSRQAVASQDRPSSAQLAGQAMQGSAAAGAWPSGNSMCNGLQELCNSLSVPGTPNPFSTAMCAPPCGMLVQEDTSWTSTVSGDTFMLPAGDAAVLASAQLAQQRTREQQALLAQHQQQQDQLRRVQQEQKRQLLLSQLGAPNNLVAGGQQLQADGFSVNDSALLANLAYAGPSTGGTAPRRASICSYVQVPVQQPQADGRACSVPTLGMQFQQMAAATSPLPNVSPAADALADAYDNALEAELDAALQQLLIMRSEVEVKKANAARNSLGGMPNASTGRNSFGGMPNGSAPGGMMANAPNGMLAAAAMSSALYQPSNVAETLVHAPNSNLYAAAQVAALPVASVCTPMTSPQVSLGGFISGAASCVQDGFGMPGQTVGREASMADWLGCNAGAGMATQQVALQVLAMRQAGMTANGAGQQGPISNAQLAALAQSMQGPFVL